MKTLLLAMVLIPCMSIGQKIKKSEIDKFTKQKRVETSKEFLRDGLTNNAGVWIRSVDTACFINLTGMNWAVGVVGPDDQAVFLLDNDETVTARSTEIQSYSISKYGNYYDHQYRISKQDLEKLAAHELKSVRRYTSKGYTDLDIKDRKKEALKELSALFLAELNK